MSSVAIAEHEHAESREFTAQPLGKIGVWWFLASEIMVFGGLIGSYILSRMAAGGWAAAHAGDPVGLIAPRYGRTATAKSPSSEAGCTFT